MRPASKSAYRLMHRGTLALSEMEQNGMRIDVPRLDRTILKVERRIGRLTERLKEDEVWKVWKRTCGGKASIGSRHQLGRVLFGEMGMRSDSRTEKTRRPQVNEESLRKLGLPFVDRFLEVEKLKKLKSTYLEGVRREVVDGLLRPSFNLHLAVTYRGSCNDPNFQNIPVRDEVIGKLIRSCFIPRDGHTLVEIDYGGHEFRVAACFWRDEAMIKYASDPTLDIHRDMAAECYCLEPDDVTEGVRFYAKNQFLFPTLYGSWYKNTSRNLWDVIGTGNLVRKDGYSLEDHLLLSGITRDGYEDHVREVEERFNERFPQWSERKERWWDRYQKRGWFPLMTGFVVSGVYTRNQVYNTPVQGPAFHCLLWSLIRLVREVRRRKMGAKITGQIHDSIVAEVPNGEVDDYVGLARRVMVDELKAAWPWVVVPLVVDAKTSTTNWHEMKDYLG